MPIVGCRGCLARLPGFRTPVPSPLPTPGKDNGLELDGLVRLSKQRACILLCEDAFSRCEDEFFEKLQRRRASGFLGLVIREFQSMECTNKSFSRAQVQTAENGLLALSLASWKCVIEGASYISEVQA